jgi:hypothetical protein
MISGRSLSWSLSVASHNNFVKELITPVKAVTKGHGERIGDLSELTVRSGRYRVVRQAKLGEAAYIKRHSAKKFP